MSKVINPRSQCDVPKCPCRKEIGADGLLPLDLGVVRIVGKFPSKDGIRNEDLFEMRMSTPSGNELSAFHDCSFDRKYLVGNGFWDDIKLFESRSFAKDANGRAFRVSENRRRAEVIDLDAPKKSAKKSKKAPTKKTSPPKLVEETVQNDFVDLSVDEPTGNIVPVDAVIQDVLEPGYYDEYPGSPVLFLDEILENSEPAQPVAEPTQLVEEPTQLVEEPTQLVMEESQCLNMEESQCLNMEESECLNMEESELIPEVKVKIEDWKVAYSKMYTRQSDYGFRPRTRRPNYKLTCTRRTLRVSHAISLRRIKTE